MIGDGSLLRSLKQKDGGMIMFAVHSQSMIICIVNVDKITSTIIYDVPLVERMKK